MTPITERPMKKNETWNGNLRTLGPLQGCIGINTHWGYCNNTEESKRKMKSKLGLCRAYLPAKVSFETSKSGLGLRQLLHN